MFFKFLLCKILISISLSEVRLYWYQNFEKMFMLDDRDDEFHIEIPLYRHCTFHLTMSLFYFALNKFW